MCLSYGGVKDQGTHNSCCAPAGIMGGLVSRLSVGRVKGILSPYYNAKGFLLRLPRDISLTSVCNASASTIDVYVTQLGVTLGCPSTSIRRVYRRVARGGFLARCSEAKFSAVVKGPP